MGNDFNKLVQILNNQAEIVNDILTRYTEDEAGQDSKEQFLKMSEVEKVSLLTNTLLTSSDLADFETDLIINFDYNNF